MVKFRNPKEHIIRGIKSLTDFLALDAYLENCTIVGIDFRGNGFPWPDIRIRNTTFLGCDFQPHDESLLRQKGAYIYPRFTGLPYDPFRGTLYNWQELLSGHHPQDDQSLDLRIYQHFSRTRFNPDINEALSQRMHDHAIDDALRDLFGFDAHGMSHRKCVGMMGGHGTLRTDPYFEKVARTAKSLTEHGYYIASGGGPGIMEAANFGAWMAHHSENSLSECLAILSRAPHYSDPGYFDAAREVLALHPDGAQSLAIPTWFYGHEPSNLFATEIAKYFSNSIREDTLLALSLHGVIYAPGSAGTTQEIFMDAAQNHYCTHNFYSPMVFLGRKRYEIDSLIFPVLRQLSFGKEYHELMHLTDAPDDAVDFILKHPPVKG